MGQFLAMLPAIGSAGAAAGTAGAGAAAAGATAAGAAGIGSTALSIMQGVMGVGSALSAVAAGRAQSAQMQAAAAQSDSDARSAQAADMQRQTQMKRQLTAALGANDLAFASGGIDLSGGAAGDARAALTRQAVSEMNADRAGAEARGFAYAAQAADYRHAAKGARRAGLIKGITTLAETGMNIAARG